jgi:hypothetical protein
MAQEFDVLGERQRQLLGRLFLTTLQRTDSCCTAK